ncbi:hypothetical protein Cgig2_007845 [Carnegiea gigantea]|uniref:BHLH transcription factor n=1 Tax=Carnegiea gigantea TaxID=171969 RepID=A0A9Q1GUD0_9CARY|nr:hypothetical protein Cgig2_007845 [Carnegiea gigantea]
MDMNDKSEAEKKNEETLSYHPPRLSTDWQYSGANVANSSMGLVANRNPMTVCGDVLGPSSSSGSMVDSFGPAVWEHFVNPTELCFNEMNMANGASTSDPLLMLKGALFLPNMSGMMLPHSLSQFPADSAFIERAARFSSFNGGHFGDMLNPLGIHQPSSPYVQGGAMMHGPEDVLPGNGMKPMPNGQSQETEGNGAETSKDGSLPTDIEGSPPRNGKTVARSCQEAKQGVSMSGNDSDEAGFSGSGAQEDPTPSSAKGLGSKKRKWGNQDAEPVQATEVPQRSGEAGKTDAEKRQKGEHNSTPTGNKSNGKNSKQTSQASDPPKEEYIHVRARRGQATNSHSLAERVTGKAVMLDEIINYVQSLQRQVEFLSMKLATVNPRLDFDIERLIAKDQMFSTRAGPSASLGYSPDFPMAYPPLHPTQHSVLQPGVPGIGSSSDALRRTITSQLTNMGGGYKDTAAQLPNNAWEDELHNIVQMGFNTGAPLENQELNCSVPSGQMKAEAEP